MGLCKCNPDCLDGRSSRPKKKVLTVNIEKDQLNTRIRGHERSMVVIRYGEELIGIPARDLTNPQAAKLVAPIKTTLEYARSLFARVAYAQVTVFEVE